VSVVRSSCVGLDAASYAAVEALPEGTTITLEGDVKNVVKTNTWNAIGRLTGTDPKLAQEVILLSAHIDHLAPRPNAPAGSDNIFNGADDDASGSVAVLELAEALAKGSRAKRTIVFAWFGSEETGGAGSRYFADKPVVPLDRIVANLQFEMIGRPDEKVPPHTLWLTGYERSTLGPELAKRGARLVQDPHPEQNFFTRSDNIQFARRGVIAHTVSSYGLHKEYHTPADEIRLIDFPHMTDSIRSMLAPIRWLADSTFKPGWLPGKKP
jgi:Zn-dependent M28 family amino/carboxypeptidase